MTQSDDIFSIAELEHNILRAAMSPPSQLLSRFVIPKSNYVFSLATKDFRLNFALNCGSLSNPTGNVPVYVPSKVDIQLERTARLFLNRTVFVKPKGSRDANISLPRVCQWFSEDFGDGSANSILRIIAPFLEEEKQATLSTLWREKKQTYEINLFTMKFSPYNFECRFLTPDKAGAK